MKLPKIKINILTYIITLVALLTGLIKYLLIAFGIILIHELGHIIIAKFFKRKITEIEVLPFGGLVKIESNLSEDIFEDLLIAVGGIFFQLLLGVIIYILNSYSYISDLDYTLMRNYNITIIAFNLIPINPLDGYKIVKLFEELIMPYKKTFLVSMIVSIITFFIIILNNFTYVQENILVFTFLLFMVIKEYKDRDFIMMRFYLERMNRVFDFKLKKKVFKKEQMYKNRTNIINGRSERDFLLDEILNK